MVQGMNPTVNSYQQKCQKLAGLSTIPSLQYKGMTYICWFETRMYKQTMLLTVLLCLLEVHLAGSPQRYHSSRNP
jgi:hypothetical protein